MGGTARLRAYLHDFFIPSGSFDHQLTFTDIMAAGFFDIHMLTRITRQNCCGAMPVIGCCDPNSINRFIIQNLTHILNALGLIPFCILDKFDCASQPCSIRLTNIINTYILALHQQSKVIGSHASGPDKTNLDCICRSLGICCNQGACSPCQILFQKSSPGLNCHDGLILVTAGRERSGGRFTVVILAKLISITTEKDVTPICPIKPRRFRMQKKSKGSGLFLAYHRRLRFRL